MAIHRTEWTAFAKGGDSEKDTQGHIKVVRCKRIVPVDVTFLIVAHGPEYFWRRPFWSASLTASGHPSSTAGPGQTKITDLHDPPTE